MSRAAFGRMLMEIVPDYKPAAVQEPVHTAPASQRDLSEKGLRHSEEMVTA